MKTFLDLNTDTCLQVCDVHVVLYFGTVVDHMITHVTVLKQTGGTVIEERAIEVAHPRVMWREDGVKQTEAEEAATGTKRQ